jgi:acetoin utilization deacetylase AcuC-like enzyme
MSVSGNELTEALVDLQRAKPATRREMTQFHTDDYIEFLHRINPENANNYAREQQKCTLATRDVNLSMSDSLLQQTM